MKKRPPSADPLFLKLLAGSLVLHMLILAAAFSLPADPGTPPAAEIPVEIVDKMPEASKPDVSAMPPAPAGQGKQAESQAERAAADAAAKAKAAEDARTQAAKAAALEKAAQEKAAQEKAAQEKAAQEKAAQAKAAADAKAAEAKQKAEAQAAESKAAAETKAAEAKQAMEAKQAETKQAEARAAAEAKAAEARQTAEAKRAEAKAAADAKAAQAKAQAQDKAQQAREAAEARRAQAQAAAEAKAQQEMYREIGRRAAEGSPRDQKAGKPLPFELPLPGPAFRAAAMPMPLENGSEPIGYTQIVFGMLARVKHYPQAALDRHAQGVAGISFSVDLAGNLVDVRLIHSSGDPDLDAEAVDVVRRAAPFPTPPRGAQLEFNAGVKFSHIDEPPPP